MNSETSIQEKQTVQMRKRAPFWWKPHSVIAAELATGSSVQYMKIFDRSDCFFENLVMEQPQNWRAQHSRMFLFRSCFKFLNFSWVIYVQIMSFRNNCRTWGANATPIRKKRSSVRNLNWTSYRTRLRTGNSLSLIVCLKLKWFWHIVWNHVA